MKCRAPSMSISARPNQRSGDIRSHSMTSFAFAQCGTTHIPNVVSEKAILTPIIEPISACELDTGSASHQAQRSHMIEANNIDRMRHIPTTVGALIISFTGNR